MHFGPGWGGGVNLPQKNLCFSSQCMSKLT